MSTATESYDLEAPTAETTRFLHERQEGGIAPEPGPTELDRSGYWSLLLQHVSRYLRVYVPNDTLNDSQMSAGGDRTAEFAFYLLLIVCFQDTLLPSALFGFSTTCTLPLMPDQKTENIAHSCIL